MNETNQPSVADELYKALADLVAITGGSNGQQTQPAHLNIMDVRFAASQAMIKYESQRG